MNYHFDADVQKLKHTLRELIDRELIAFADATGVHPSGVTIQIVETTTYASKVKAFTVGTVEISFDL